MKIKTTELIGPALDWAVAECLIADGHLTRDQNDHSKPLLLNGNLYVSRKTGVTDLGRQLGAPEYTRGAAVGKWNPSAMWSQAGQIIAREKLAVGWSENDQCWFGWGMHCELDTIAGRTPTEAVMRYYVASKMGDDVDVPDDLCV